MPGSLDLHGMFAALECRGVPAPLDPLEELAAVAEITRDRMRIFDPSCTADPPPQPVAPRGRRPGR
ncbi:hypothetical protein [Patulibacter sp.]|uniref:hypothetical protein n=1 Tax=Patulibacter sp. TaxID=1912859 RepID=UPI002721FA2E|nr:hypothetical protein [Patulibacter sp.]MDO9409641.1 hypothetical protein [Patulibacter sp.]